MQMRPCQSALHARNHFTSDLVPIGDALLGLASVEALEHVARLCLGQLCHSVRCAAQWFLKAESKGMELLVSSRHPFQVACAVVVLLAALVVDGEPFRARSVEGFADERVNVYTPADRTSRETDRQVVTKGCLFQNVQFSVVPAASATLGSRSHTPSVADFVTPFPSSNMSPFFLHSLNVLQRRMA